MNFIKDILKGIVIGIANIIPGVSGGTMMVSMGIYDKIISSITNLFKRFKKSVLTLFPYAVGILLGIIGFAFVITYLFEHFPLQTAAIFIGLILGGLPMITKKIKGRKPEVSGILLFLLFFALVAGLQFIEDKDAAGTDIVINLANIVKLLFLGIIASATMIIPGVSGSLVLMALGYYNTILENLNGFITALANAHIAEALEHACILLPFGIGVLLGIFAVAKLIEVLLKKQERRTYFSILGLVCASPIAVLLGIDPKNVTPLAVITGLIAFAAGFAAAYLLSGEEKT